MGNNSVCGSGLDPVFNPNVVRCHLAIIREDGGFSVLVLNLPGIGSSGPTEELAVVRTREAIAGAVECYRVSGEEIPWASDYADDIPEGAKLKWVLVDV
jgi:predicted RNase H-like HicB family nuclease